MTTQESLGSNLMTKKVKSAFTLLEVLIAGGILFIVSAGVVGLSNSIIQGTTLTNDATITNRWAAEGLELSTKIRDEKSKSASFSTTGEIRWFGDAVATSDNYGWYHLVPEESPNPVRWELVKLIGIGNTINLTEFSPTVSPYNSIESISSDNLIGYRLICVESFGSVKNIDVDNQLTCNTDGGAKVLSDGDRSVQPDCDVNDLYCLLTEPSLNLHGPANNQKIIPNGNAVKVRSIVLWGDRGTWKTSNIATVLTNWRSLAN